MRHDTGQPGGYTAVADCRTEWLEIDHRSGGETLLHEINFTTDICFNVDGVRSLGLARVVTILQQHLPITFIGATSVAQ